MSIKYIMFFIIAIMFNFSINLFSMLPEETQQVTTLVRSLKKICLGTVRQLLSTQDLDTLPRYKLNIECLSQLPKEVSKKLGKHVFFVKCAYNTQQHYSQQHFDEIHNKIILETRWFGSEEKKQAINIVNLDTGESKEFSLKDNGQFVPSYSQDYKTIVLCGYDNNQLMMIHNWGESSSLYTYPKTTNYYCCTFGNNVDMDTNELILYYGLYMKKCLLNLTAGTIKYPESKRILSDNDNNFYLVESDEVATLYKKVNETDHRQLCTFRPHCYFAFNPNGKQLLISDASQKTCRLMSLREDKIINLDHYITDDYKIISSFFNKAGEYVLLVHFSDTNTTFIKYILHNTETGACCGTLKLPYYTPVSFEGEYLVLNGSNDTVSLISLQKLLSLQKNEGCIETHEELIKRGIATPFQKKLNLPKYIIQKNSQNQHVLMHNSSEKIIATFNNVSNIALSSMGKMLFLKHTDGTSQILSLRHDFTAAEYVLYRLMTEKKLTESDVQNDSDLQKVYDTMKTENKHGYFLIKK